MEAKEFFQLPFRISHELTQRFRTGFRRSLATAEPRSFNINPAAHGASYRKLEEKDKQPVFGLIDTGRAAIAGLLSTLSKPKKP